MPLIGTAGHVDHGKSTLIEWVTGRHPDRFEEERRRGLTIDLGFAWATLPDGTEVSFVDVPGHERYLKNMLAGIEAIDVAVFVVAADEGWMPQSEEHLAVLDLLGVDRGVVALTKIDAAEPDLAEVARAEVAERLRGSSLEAAPIHMVSGVTGQGVDALLQDLARLLPPEAADSGRPRLWVDRSFTISGAGTVVTGSLLGSSLSVDETVEIYPEGIEARIRGMQSHEEARDRLAPGRRTAINLAGIDHDSVGRGDMVGLAGQWELSSRFSATLRPARYVGDLDSKGAYTLHIGSGAHRVDLLMVEDGIAIMALDRPLPLGVGDRFIVRDTGRKLVVGGGRVLDPEPGKTRQAVARALEIDPDSTPDQIATWLLAGRGTETLTRLAAHSGGGAPAGAVVVADLAVDPGRFQDLADEATTLVEREHEQRPLRPGLSIATLAERLAIGRDIAESIVDRTDRLERRGPDVASPGHQAGLTEDQQQGWVRARKRLAEGLAVPDESELGLDNEVLHLKLREGELVRIAPGLVYLPGQIEELEELIVALDGEFTVAEFRDAAGLSRKYAVPILEWSDRKGLTVRRGDLRRVR
jgi:selenocysteine-specific elongation factor